MSTVDPYAARQAAELARVPIGARVRVRGAPGLGVGTVLSHITSETQGSERNRITIPLIGWAKARVELDSLDEGKLCKVVHEYKTRDLIRETEGEPKNRPRRRK